MLAPSPQRPIKCDPRNSKTEESDYSKINCELGSVVEHVMAHFMSHDRADLRKGALFEQIIVQGDPGGAEHAGYVRTDARCLTGGVDFEDLLHGNLIGLRHGQNRVADFRVRQRLVSVEEWFDVNWRNEIADE